MTRAEMLADAYKHYSSAKTWEEHLNAYYGILFLGGKDGYGPSPWRALIARCFRRMALSVEGQWRFTPEQQRHGLLPSKDVHAQ